MLSICPTICSTAVAFPLYLDLQKQMFALGWQEEQMRCPFPQLNIFRGGFMESRQIGQEGIREEREGGGVGVVDAGAAAGAEEGPGVETTLLNPSTSTRARIMKVTNGCKNKMNIAILKMNQTADKPDSNTEIIIVLRECFYD